MDLEVRRVGWSLGESLANVLKSLLVHPGVAHLEGVLTLKEARPGGVQPVLVEGLGLLSSLLEGLLADLFVFVNDGGGFLFSDNSLLLKLLRIKI